MRCPILDILHWSIPTPLPLPFFPSPYSVFLFLREKILFSSLLFSLSLSLSVFTLFSFHFLFVIFLFCFVLSCFSNKHFLSGLFVLICLHFWATAGTLLSAVLGISFHAALGFTDNNSASLQSPADCRQVVRLIVRIHLHRAPRNGVYSDSMRLISHSSRLKV